MTVKENKESKNQCTPVDLMYDINTENLTCYTTTMVGKLHVKRTSIDNLGLHIFLKFTVQIYDLSYTHLYSLPSTGQGRSQKKLMTEAMSMEDL